MSEITFRSDMTVDLIDSMGNDDSVIRSAKVSTMTDTAVDDMSTASKESVAKSAKNFMSVSFLKSKIFGQSEV